MPSPAAAPPQQGPGKPPSLAKVRDNQGLSHAQWFHLPLSAALQASREALLGAAKLLKWKQLRNLLETAQPQRIGECLVRTTARGLPKPGPDKACQAWPRVRGGYPCL